VIPLSGSDACVTTCVEVSPPSVALGIEHALKRFLAFFNIWSSFPVPVSHLKNIVVIFMLREIQLSSLKSILTPITLLV
jgi:hypothetical protein